MNHVERPVVKGHRTPTAYSAGLVVCLVTMVVAGCGHHVHSARLPLPASQPIRSAPTAGSAARAPTPAAAPGPCRGVARPTRWRHVVWVWLENKSFDQVIGSSAAPYLNTLAGSCGLVTDHGVAHPSLPNYVAAVSGGRQGIYDDAGPASHRLPAPSVFSQLGTDWRSYLESMPGPCQQTSSGNYAVKHNPAAYFTDLAPLCASNDLPLPTHPDLSAAFTFIAPNLCDDMHDCSVATGDAWLAGFIPMLTNTPAYQSGTTLLVITFDESDSGGGNQIPTLLVAPCIKPGTRIGSSGPFWTHYTLLATTEDLLGLPRLGAAQRAGSFAAAAGL